jgi:hypothetical protein
MKKYFIFLLFYQAPVHAQNRELSICEKDSVYNADVPNTIVEMSSIYHFGDTIKFYTVDTLISFNDILFKKVATNKNDSKTYHFFSEGIKGELYWLDTIEYKVKILIPSEEIEGYELKNVLGLDYKIAGYHVKIETPVCKDNDALMFLTKNTYLNDYETGEVFYYVRGIGFVASEYRGIIESYITRRYILDKKGNR